jgi:toxin ParE1/3/4
VNLSIRKSPFFQEDVTSQFEWYFDNAGEKLARRFFNAVDTTLLKLARQPDLGRRRRFKHSLLSGLRSFQVESPFDRLLIFYREQSGDLVAERLMHGARDLPRRLTEPPGT